MKTKVDPEEAEERKAADRMLARIAWGLVWNRKTPLWATLAIAVVFSLRVVMCDYTDPVPEGLNFQWYGEHCGPGHGDPDTDAVDELDAACKRHDAAYEEDKKNALHISD